MTTLDLVDGTYELFRAHFSKRPEHTAPDGQPVKATVGLVSALLAMLQGEDPKVTHLAVAFDNPIRSFRNRLLDSYKTEEGVDPALLAQFDLAEDAVRAIGVTVWSMDEHEADDALATAAARFAPEVEQVRIHTVDKDLGQCIVGRKVVQLVRKNDPKNPRATLDEDAFRALRGIAPESIPDWLALVGDTADGIPGIAGFGEKTAAAILARYGHLEQIPADPAAWDVPIRSKDRLAAALAEGRENALLYRKVATLVRDVPLKESLADLEWKGVLRAEWTALCDRLGVTTLRSSPTRWRG